MKNAYKNPMLLKLGKKIHRGNDTESLREKKRLSIEIFMRRFCRASVERDRVQERERERERERESLMHTHFIPIVRETQTTVTFFY